MIFAVTRGHSMGLSSAVTNFNRVPDIVTTVCRRILAIALWHYFDDYGYICLRFELDPGPQGFQHVSSLLGFAVSPDKHHSLSDRQEHLGLLHDFTQTSSDIVALDSKAGRVQACLARIDSLISDGEYPTDEINSLRSEIVFMMRTSLGKQARGGIQLLSGSKGDILAGPIFFRRVLEQLQPRPLLLHRELQHSIRCYSDACREPRLLHPAGEVCVTVASDHISQAFCGLGGLVADSDKLYAVASEASASWHSFLCPRITQIAPAELVAVCGTVYSMIDRLCGRHAVFFIDNAAICSALVAGKSSQPDLQFIITAFHIYLCQHDISWWVEWVPSDSDPSDILRRELCHPDLPVDHLHIPWWAHACDELHTLLGADLS